MEELKQRLEEHFRYVDETTLVVFRGAPAHRGIARINDFDAMLEKARQVTGLFKGVKNIAKIDSAASRQQDVLPGFVPGVPNCPIRQH